MDNVLDYNLKLAESDHFVVTHCCEEVNLLIKQSGKSVCVGDFYGDPEGVLIDKDEKWICSYGAGMTVYFIKEPFSPWMYDSETSQWLNYGKGGCSEDVVWIKNVKQVEDFKIEVEFESGMKSNFEISDNAIKIL